MNDKQLIETINRRIDGDLNEQESAALDRYLAEHPKAAELAARMVEMEKTLQAVADSNPEADLVPGVMSRINKEKYRTEEKRSGILAERKVWQWPAFRMAFIYAVGIFSGILILSVVRSGQESAPVDTDQLRGSMLSAPVETVWIPGDVLNFQGRQTRATCRSRYSPQVAELYLDLSSYDMMETVIEFSPDDFELLAVVNEIVGTNTTTSTTMNQVTINSNGDNKLGIKLANKNDLEHEISFKITQRGTVLYQGNIIINKQ